MDDQQTLPPAVPPAVPPRAALSLADQVFVNYMAALSCNRIENRDRRNFAREIAAEVLPKVTRGNRYLDPILEAFGALERQDDPKVSRAFELLNLSVALSEFFMWRGGMAYDAFARASKAEEQGT